MYLSDLDKGQKGVIRKVCDIYMKELGFIPGAKIKVISKSPFNGPIAVFIKGTRFALRLEEAACVII
ncbi:ferrous iron transport protein A [Candidatus Pacearchaeota archaeon]|nr:ferrous iron transport protein A [Candidatus Pacearchaeota archaeon]|tara:strand:- start:2543 stop:2743 length:201 start_codon:yes stop_codon:yes gene_type:complete